MAFRNLAVSVVLFSTLVTSAASAQAAYSKNADSVTTKPLPSNVMSHCYGNTSNCSAGDAIAKCTMTDCGDLSEINNPTYMGLFEKPSPGDNDFGGPVYYSASTDPWYSSTVATPSGHQTITFHAPNGALIAEGVEGSLTIWDQYTGWVVGTYICCGPQTGRGLPKASGCGSTQATACSFSTTYLEAASNLFTGQTYGYTPNASSSIQLAPAALMTRDLELQSGVINHALLFNVDCVNSTAQYVFPSIFPALGLCGSRGFGSQNTTRPSGGTLLFLDYTPAQIGSFNLPAWQTALLTAFATYGGYVGGTGGSDVGISMVDGSVESSEAWKYYYPSTGCTSTNCYNNPFWTWAETQKGFNGSNNLNAKGCGGSAKGTNPSAINCEGFFLTNIPRTVGPEGFDSEGNSCTVSPGCYPTGHIHVADSCIAKGFANLSGGCS